MTYEEIESKKTPRGGYTKAQLAEWGVKWPPRPGWKKRLVGGDPNKMAPATPTGIGIEAYFDGGCDPNPGGHGSASCYVLRNGVEVFRKSVYLGKGPDQSNNSSEHIAAGLAIAWVSANRIDGESVTIFGDSALIINQLAGKWKAYSGAYLPHYHANRLLLANTPAIKFSWIPREHNEECDAMCTLEIEEGRLSKNVLYSGVDMVDK